MSNAPAATPLQRPDLSHIGVAAWAKLRICEAVAANFSEEERGLFAGSWSACHCGRCGGYARCKFAAPRCVGDVLHNVDRTGGKAASRIATVGKIVDHFEDDVVISFGMGAGTCVAAWELTRGAAVRSLFGVEVEPIATRVARAAFPYAHIRTSVEELDISRAGRLIVITSLVMNLIPGATARAWAACCAQHPEEVLWINVGRTDEPGAFSNFHGELEQHGLRPMHLPLPVSVDQFDNGYCTTASWWRR